MAFARVPLSVRFPVLYGPIVAARRLARAFQLGVQRRAWASAREVAPLAVRVDRHASRLIRPHSDCPRWLQENKVRNLAVARAALDGVVLRPGETFSFWRLVGRPTRARGFVDGLELAQGRARPGVGGGLCQLANMIHWLALHSPLEVLERSTHSVDPFPDSSRSIPFGTGAAVFWNYIDLVLHNPTDTTFQLRLGLTEKDLVGELRASREMQHGYHVFERAHRFVREGAAVMRENEIWRRVFVRKGGATVREELIKRNRARVLYAVEAERVGVGT